MGFPGSERHPVDTTNRAVATTKPIAMTERTRMRILVTGGCGFIGSALVLHLVQDLGHEVATLDALTYAANPISLQPLANDSRHRLVEADICDPAAVHALYAEFRPEAVMHLAAESHVDRSITD